MYKLHISELDAQLGIDETTCYLCLINVNAVPPHISLICNGLYYSYSVYGIKLGSQANARIATFEKRNIPSILINVGALWSTEEVQTSYQKLDNLQPSSSCLLPITHLLQTKGMAVTQHPMYVFDVIEWLEKHHLIKEVLTVKCEHLIKNNTIELPRYTQSEIDAQIITLSKGSLD